MHDHKQKYVGLVPNVEFKHILQPLKYIISIVNRFDYIDINATTTRSITPMNLLGPC